MKKLLVLLMVLAISLSSGFAGGQSESSSNDSGVQPLRVAMECGYAPYNWTQTDDSNGAIRIKDSNDYAFGYDVMMAKIVAEGLNRPLEIVKLDWDSLVPAVQSGTIDCVIAGQSPTPARKQMVDFTDPYYYASVVCMTLNDSEFADAQGLSDLNGGSCTSQLGTLWYDTCLPQIEGANILPAQESAPAMLVALNSGRVDFICTDMPTAQAALVAYPNMKILSFVGSDDDFELSQSDIDISISVSKDNPELTSAINEILATMDEKDYNEMMAKAIEVQPLSN